MVLSFAVENEKGPMFGKYPQPDLCIQLLFLPRNY